MDSLILELLKKETRGLQIPYSTDIAKGVPRDPTKDNVDQTPKSLKLNKGFHTADYEKE